MGDLRQIQKDFIKSIYNKTDVTQSNDIKKYIISHIIESEDRLSIYRNNTYVLLKKVLKMTYPATLALVGNSFFDYVISSFVSEHPSLTGDLNEYGIGFADFLAGVESVKNYPYLPDVAKLEWKITEATYMPECPEINLAKFSYFSADDYARMQLIFNPAFSLMISPYPVHKIWKQVLETPEQLNVDINSGEAYLAICRFNYQPMALELSKPEYIFIASLVNQNTLLEAYEEVCEYCETANDRFDLIEGIGVLVMNHFITSYMMT